MLGFLPQKIFIWIFISHFLIGIPGGCRQWFDNQLTSEELKVLNFLLAGKSDEQVIIDNSILRTLGICKSSDFEIIISEVDEDTSVNFLKINKFPTNINKSIKLDSGNLVINKSEFEEKSSITNGYFIFSRIGFSDNGRQALVWFSDNRNPLGKTAGFYLLEKEKGFWRIKSESEKIKS